MRVCVQLNLGVSENWMQPNMTILVEIIRDNCDQSMDLGVPNLLVGSLIDFNTIVASQPDILVQRAISSARNTLLNIYISLSLSLCLSLSLHRLQTLTWFLVCAVYLF